MDILPIEKLRDEDAPIVGADLVNLAALSRDNFPVAPGLVVYPPEIELSTVLKYFNLNDKEIFEQSLTLVKKEILKIPTPVEFTKALSRRKVGADEIWTKLLDIWLGEIRTKVWKQGFKDGATLGLSAQPVFFISKVVASGEAYWDSSQNMVEVKITHGEIKPKAVEDIEEVVKKGDKKLLLPQVYHWMIEEGSSKVWLVRLSQYSGSVPALSQTEEMTADAQPAPFKSAMKVYLDLSEGLVTNPNVDGVLISGEKAGDFENQVFKLVESGISFENLPVIFKLSDKIEHIGGVRGSLRLIHQESLLKSEAEAFLFARNNKKLLNVQICVPFVRSIHEFLEMKRSLATMGVTRKGTMKLWLELAVPENIINIEEYVVAGMDGIILNLDELSSWLGGFDDNLTETIFYQKQVTALLKFLEDALRVLHRAGIPIIATGNLSLNDDVLEFLVARGVKGVVVNLANSHSLHEHLRFVEKRYIRSKSA